MQRGSWVFRNGRMVPKAEALAKDYAIIASKRSKLAAPAVVSDNMEPFKSHVDGKTWFDSKRAWEKHVKASGHQIVGNDMPETPTQRFNPEKHRKDVEADVALAYQMVEQGYQAPPTDRAAEFDTREIAAAARKNGGVAYVEEAPTSIPDEKVYVEGKKPSRSGGGRKSKRK